MTPLAAIRARADAATPGPWEPQDAGRTVRATVDSPESGARVAWCDVNADAAFIAHARADVLLLLKVADAARGVIGHVDDPEDPDHLPDPLMLRLREALRPLIEEAS